MRVEYTCMCWSISLCVRYGTWMYVCVSMYIVYMYVCVFIYEQPERTRVCVERMRTFVVHGHILIFCACPIAFICVHTRELSSGTFFYSSFCLSLESIVVAIELYRLV